MSAHPEDLPIVVGVGEASDASLGLEWPSPIDLAKKAVECALRDTRQAERVRTQIDTVVAIRSFRDSGLAHPFGGPNNVPEAIARAARISPRRLVYGEVGGHSPQRYVHEFSRELHGGTARLVLIAGAEAMRTCKRALASGRELRWDQPSTRAFENRSSPVPILSRAEIRHGVRSMILAYGLIENAQRVLRAPAWGRPRSADSASDGIRPTTLHAERIAEIGAAFARVAQTRTHARYPRAVSPEALVRPEDSNYRVSDPYLRWMVAQDSVDLGAAALLTTVRTARELEIPPDRWLYLHGGGDCDAPPLSERARVAHSDALERALGSALDSAQVIPQQLGPIDLYSCFPCAVTLGIDALGIRDRSLDSYTCTGGLTFFGGPGNDYSLHGLAALCDRLRREPDRPGLLLANGGVLGKLSVGVYAAYTPKHPFSAGAEPVPQLPAEITVRTPDGTEPGSIESYTRPYVRGAPRAAIAFVQLQKGGRTVAELEEHTQVGELLLRAVTCSIVNQRVVARITE